MFARAACVLVFLFSLFQSDAVAQQKTILGILPVFDASGDVQSEIFTSHLTLMVYERLQKSTVQPHLLNPGALYNPLNTEWPIEFGESAGVDVVLISTMLGTEKPKKGDWTLKIETSLLDIRTGKKTGPFLHRYDIDRRYVGENVYVTTGGIRQGAVVEFVSRPFDKQPMGKAARTLAESIAAEVPAQSETIASRRSGTSSALDKGRCTTDFAVAYTTKKTNSKAYQVVANGKDESLWIKDGVAHLEVASGLLVLQVSTDDSPYRLPVQRLYQADTVVDCSRAERKLVLEISGGGEALLRWY